MTDDQQDNPQDAGVSRRAMLAGAAGLAAVSAQLAACNGRESGGAAVTPSADAIRNAPRAPFDSLRDYMAAIEAWGLVVRVPRIDQDEYEMTAMMYRLIDEFGWYEAPAILAEEVKIDGRWIRGPVICNHQGHWYKIRRVCNSISYPIPTNFYISFNPGKH